MADEPAPAARPRLCPLCRRPSDPRFRPFCSARCRDRDLLAWLEERYAVPVVETDPDEGDATEATRPDEEHERASGAWERSRPRADESA